MRGGSASVTELEAIASAQRTGRGSAQLGFLLPMIDSRAESVGESVSRAVIVWSGFEPPELQLELISEGHRDRVDFAWRAARVLGESDGYEKYRTETSEEAVQRIIDEKRREDRLRRQCRSFGRWDWTTTVRVTPLVQRLDAMTVPRIGPPRDALLATLASNARSLPRARNHS